MKKWLHMIPVGLLLLAQTRAYAQYISEVFEYIPAPGQFTNEAPWGIPSSATSIVGGINGSLGLGSYGGYVVFRFEHPVEDHPLNPYGVDFTIFGNPLTHWSEPGIVWVSVDSNGNGMPDDQWYELAGSDYYFSTSFRDYKVTYQNPGDSLAKDVPWVDNRGNSGSVLANDVHLQPYYPESDSFPSIYQEQYTLKGSVIQAVLNPHDFLGISSKRRAFGYADNQVRGSAPYTLPDNPYTHEVEHSGGDAFDIQWAVDSTGNYVDLDKIHFVKVQNGVQGPGGWLGELSTEITGAVDVEEDSSVSGMLDIIVIKDLPLELKVGSFQLEAFVFRQGRLIPDEPIVWTSNLPGASVNEDLLLTISGPGELILTASLVNNPLVQSQVSITITTGPTSFSLPAEVVPLPEIFPNPARDHFRISIEQTARILIFDITGKCRLSVVHYHPGNSIDISGLQKGSYVVMIQTKDHYDRLKLLKN